MFLQFQELFICTNLLESIFVTFVVQNKPVISEFSSYLLAAVAIPLIFSFINMSSRFKLFKELPDGANVKLLLEIIIELQW